MGKEYYCIPIIPVEVVIHTPEHPFCSDLGCPCHCDESVAEYIDPRLDEGTLSGAQALRLYFGQE
jgi:hypothetical protein